MAKSDKTAGILLVILFGCGLFMSTAFPERASYFPQFICIVGLLLSVLLIVMAFMKEKRGQKEDTESKISPTQRKRLLLMAFMIIVYAVAVEFVGFTVSSILFMVAASWMLYPGKISKENKKPAIIILIASVVISVAIYIVFKNLLYVPLPSGLLF